jgi:hypothetical protein
MPQCIDPAVQDSGKRGLASPSPQAETVRIFISDQLGRYVRVKMKRSEMKRGSYTVGWLWSTAARYFAKAGLNGMGPLGTAPDFDANRREWVDLALSDFSNVIDFLNNGDVLMVKFMEGEEAGEGGIKQRTLSDGGEGMSDVSVDLVDAEHVRKQSGSSGNRHVNLQVPIKPVQSSQSVEPTSNSYGAVSDSHSRGPYSAVKSIGSVDKPVTIDLFEREKLIGVGGFSEVWRVKKKDSGRIYAMKVVKRKAISSPSDSLKLSRLLNEKDVLHRTRDCRFTVKLYWALTDADNAYLITEYCPGGELSIYLFC